ncbi:MAG: hypothetical protein GXP61_06595 [Epsilonproteobacteria bacterium]|nr:hypothetical protein [Campylobacterota bacterium]
MKLYKTTIAPISNFATLLKGDTIFGQICWALSFVDKNRFQNLLSKYETSPFLIVSDGFASGYLPKPTIPSVYLNEDGREKKINRKKIWLTSKELENLEFHKARTDKEVGNIDKKETITRNSINYKTFTTGQGSDPYGVDEMSISKKDIYFLIGDNFTLEELQECFELVSKMGYGKDSSIGKGRFSFDSFKEIKIDNISTTFMTLSPFSPEKLECKELFYTTFTRFGKTGATRANRNPFKKPILFADTGTVVIFEEKKEINYIGKAIKDISTYRDIVHQGYSIVMPLKDIS